MYSIYSTHTSSICLVFCRSKDHVFIERISFFWQSNFNGVIWQYEKGL